MLTIEQAVRSTDVVVIVGTGVSAAISGSAATATWRGLLDAGVEHAVAHRPDLDPKWEPMVRKMLDFDDIDSLVNAAGWVKKALLERGTQCYADWLDRCLGDLPVVHAPVAAAIVALGYPVLTTNYDTLLEQATGRPSVLWTDSRGIAQVLTGARNNGIGHVHGIWSVPESVVLSGKDYDTVLASDALQALQQSVATLKTIIYVGVGAGLSDPNFANLLTWHRSTFPSASNRHFRLCLEHELPALRAEHAGDNIEPVSYGVAHDDLAGYLNKLAVQRPAGPLGPLGVHIDRYAEARHAMELTLISEAVFTGPGEDRANLGVADVVVPPVLLPVPHSEYIRMRKRKDSTIPVDRIDVEADVLSGESLLLVADEEHGLTTALRWFAWQITNRLGAAAPVYVNFKNCRKPSRPLEEQLAQELRALGFTVTGDSTLPTHVIALDDFNANVPRISDRVIDGLVNNSQGLVTLIGCKQGQEDAVRERLQAAGLPVRVRYVGKLDRVDIVALARSASPSGFAALADRVLSVLQRERLPRTPFSVCLIISILARGEAVAASASQANVLDQYVSLLLGRGSPHEDDRLGIDINARELLLSYVAQSFVEADSAGLRASEVIARIESVLDQLGWKVGRAATIFENLVERRVLRHQGQHVVFSRSSYLYLFAAKRARADVAFLERLVTRPLYHAAILKAYAALTRDNAVLLREVADLLAIGDRQIAGLSPYEELELDEPAPLLGQAEPVTEANKADSQHVARILSEVPDDVDRPPFPAEDPDLLPFELKLFRVLDLVSTVLRDSDQVLDLALKQELLQRTLRTWGVLVRALTNDPSFQDFARELVKDLDLNFEKDLSATEREEFMEHLVRVLPPTIAIGGVGYTLASLKLLGAFERALDTNQLHADEDTMLGAVFFCFTLRQPDWLTHIRRLLADKENIWVVRNFLLFLLVETYIEDDQSPATSEALAGLCTDIVAKSMRFASDVDRGRYRGDYMQFLQRERLTRRTRNVLVAAPAQRKI